jgi:hypothetical protein
MGDMAARYYFGTVWGNAIRPRTNGGLQNGLLGIDPRALG